MGRPIGEMRRSRDASELQNGYMKKDRLAVPRLGNEDTTATSHGAEMGQTIHQSYAIRYGRA